MSAHKLRSVLSLQMFACVVKGWLKNPRLTFAPHALQECATIGGGIPICRQAQTKLEVCLYMFLWSPDTEAVLVAMSCFRHLCEEADIRSAADEVPVQTILPNYATFSELASVSNMMGTGSSLPGPWSKRKGSTGTKNSTRTIVNAESGCTLAILLNLCLYPSKTCDSRPSCKKTHVLLFLQGRG